MAVEQDGSSFLTNILKPGSSLNPTFLFVVDAAFLFLFLVFVTVTIITGGNIHIFFLIAIELCLWASVKWFVNELKQVPEEVKDSKED